MYLFVSVCFRPKFEGVVEYGLKTVEIRWWERCESKCGNAGGQVQWCNESAPVLKFVQTPWDGSNAVIEERQG